MLGMEERIRITFDVPDDVRRALNIYAARKNLSVGEVIEAMSRKYLPDDLALARKSIEEGDPPPKARKSRKKKPPE